MATENQDNDKMETAPSLTTRGASRRRLAKAGIGAGIIATLESKSAMAADLVCRAPSGSLSHGLAASHYKNGSAPICEGRSPGYWKNTSAWPVARDMMFTAVFYAKQPETPCPPRAAEYKHGDHYNPGSYFYARLEDLLNPQHFDQNKVGMHLVAAFLNYRSGKIGFIDLTDLQTMWSELQSTGRYSPTAGVYWDNSQVADYLASIHER